MPDKTPYQNRGSLSVSADTKKWFIAVLGELNNRGFDNVIVELAKEVEPPAPPAAPAAPAV